MPTFVGMTMDAWPSHQMTHLFPRGPLGWPGDRADTTSGVLQVKAWVARADQELMHLSLMPWGTGPVSCTSAAQVMHLETALPKSTHELHSVASAPGGNAMISVQKARRSARYRAAQQPTDPVTVILSTGMAGEAILPWAVIWLSDIFLFDVPGWSPWVLFGGPPALSLLARLIHWDLRTWSKQSLSASVSARSERA